MPLRKGTVKKNKGKRAAEVRQGEVSAQNGTRRWDLYSKLVLSPDNTCGPMFLNYLTKPPTHTEDSQLVTERVGGGGTGPAGHLLALTWPSL